jgi:hypothetical protein
MVDGVADDHHHHAYMSQYKFYYSRPDLWTKEDDCAKRYEIIAYPSVTIIQPEHEAHNFHISHYHGEMDHETHFVPYLQKEATKQLVKFNEELGEYAEVNAKIICAIFLPLGTEDNPHPPKWWLAF